MTLYAFSLSPNVRTSNSQEAECYCSSSIDAIRERCFWVNESDMYSVFSLPYEMGIVMLTIVDSFIYLVKLDHIEASYHRGSIA